MTYANTYNSPSAKTVFALGPLMLRFTVIVEFVGKTSRLSGWLIITILVMIKMQWRKKVCSAILYSVALEEERLELTRLTPEGTGGKPGQTCWAQEQSVRTPCIGVKTGFNLGVTANETRFGT